VLVGLVGGLDGAVGLAVVVGVVCEGLGCVGVVEADGFVGALLVVDVFGLGEVVTG
jgi:hypothetical protein